LFAFHIFYDNAPHGRRGSLPQRHYDIESAGRIGTRKVRGIGEAR
jgi:hypothetical protein